MLVDDEIQSHEFLTSGDVLQRHAQAAAIQKAEVFIAQAVGKHFLILKNQLSGTDIHQITIEQFAVDSGVGDIALLQLPSADI